MQSAPQGAASVSANSSLSQHVAQSASADPHRICPRIPEMATLEMRERLPLLDDDSLLNVEMEHVVVDDGNPDIAFRGHLLASVAPENRGQDRWREYRVYRTAGGNFVFSNVGRSLNERERDKFEASVVESDKSQTSIFTPVTAVGPGGFQTRVLVDLPRPLEAQLATALGNFFGYDLLAKQLYARLGIEVGRRIS
jgi:hypothetical protein